MKTRQPEIIATMIAESECSRATATITAMSSTPITRADFPKTPVPNLKALPIPLTEAMKSSLNILVILPGSANAPKNHTAVDEVPLNVPGFSCGFPLLGFSSFTNVKRPWTREPCSSPTLVPDRKFVILSTLTATFLSNVTYHRTPA